MKLNALLAAALVACSGVAAADTFDLGVLDANGESQEREFARFLGFGSAAGNFTDYYSFSLIAPSTGATGTTSVDWSWGWGTELTLNSATLYRVGSALALASDSSPSSFSFTNLAAGSYTLAIAGFFQPGVLSTGGAQYTVNIGSIGGPVASAAPEASSFAMALLGLVGVGLMSRRRRS